MAKNGIINSEGVPYIRNSRNGAIDGKNIIMQARRRSGNIFFNYQKSFSIVLLAVCNSNYEFTLADIGKAGR